VQSKSPTFLQTEQVPVRDCRPPLPTLSNEAIGAEYNLYHMQRDGDNVGPGIEYRLHSSVRMTSLFKGRHGFADTEARQLAVRIDV